MKPDEFWNMTLNEIVDMVEAYGFAERRRDDIENHRTAWFTSQLMTTMIAVHGGKKKVNPEDLYKPMDQKKDNKKQKRFESKEEKDKYMQDLFKKFDK